MTEPFRDTLWNIPHWITIAMYTAQAIAVLALIYGLSRRLSLYRQGKGELRFDKLPQRFMHLITHAVGQLRIARQSIPGLMHLMMFWGFLVLFLGTVLATIDADITVPLLGFKLLKSNLYLFYETTLDLFGLFFVLGLLIAIKRRYIDGSVRLSYDWGWALMLGSLLAINITGFLIEGLRLSATQPWWQLYSPVGYLTSLGFNAFGLSEAAIRGTHLGLWSIHFVFVAIFLGTIPYTPLIHLVTSPLNVFFARMDDRPQTLRPIPNIEEAETWGAGTLQEFGWNQLLNFDACTECGRCQVACPAWNAGMPLNPKHVVVDLRNNMLAESGFSHSAIGGFDNGYESHVHTGGALVGDVIRDETLWACTTCRACVHECPVFIEHVDAIVDMRRHLTMTEGRTPDNVSSSLRNLERTGNPWGYGPDERFSWADGLDVPLMADKQEAEYLYFVGCSASHDSRNQRIARAFVTLMQNAGVDFAVLGPEESCNGDPARRLGHEYLFEMMAERNINTLDQYKFDKVVTACPHCFNVIGNEYKDFGGDYEMVHHSQLLSQLVDEGKLTPTKEVNEVITFHDSCYLGRYNGEYDAPRKVLASIPGVELREMPRSREQGLCCGGGGGGMWLENEGNTRIEKVRLEEAMGVNPSTVASACPFCMTMFDSGSKVMGIDEQVQLRDIAEVLADSVEIRDGGAS